MPVGRSRPRKEKAVAAGPQRATTSDGAMDEHEERGHWKSPLDFVVSCLGYAVGLGNFWRFPFLCYQHGGGSFLIPYFAMLFIAGLPLFLLEIALGQLRAQGPVKTFASITPWLKGLGFGMVLVGLFFSFFYIVVVSWSLFYLAGSVAVEWSSCDHHYNSPQCSANSSVHEFWSRHVLGIAEGDEPQRLHDWRDFGLPRWQSATALAAAWLILCASLLRGIRSSGKVVYFTALFPYVVLVALCVRGVTLDGAEDGLLRYFRPQWFRLGTLAIWTDAATQVIFSLGPACGCVITLASYNKSDRDCVRDAVVVALINSATSILCGVVVFSIIGFMAKTRGVGFDEVVEAGPGLAFIVYPEAMAHMSGAPVWATLFFVMLISLAFGSLFCAFETVLAAATDQFPALRKHRTCVVFTLAALMFVLGLPFTCGGGFHLFNLFNASAPSWNLLVLAFLEVASVSWMYGSKKLLAELSASSSWLGSTICKWYWLMCWNVLTPVVLVALLVMSWLNFGHVQAQEYVYPTSVQILGYCITASTLLPLPVWAITELCNRSIATESGGTPV